MKIVDQKIFLGLASLHLAAMRDDPGLLVEFVDTLEPEVPKAEKWVLMVSTQFGCAVGCRMCDAGSLGYQGNLTAEEILDQVRYIFRANVNLDVKTHPKIKIHFARMGEPSLNPNVLIALRSLAKEFPYPGIVPSLSSVAPKTPATGSFFEELIDIKDEFFSQGRFQMQFSLHSTDERRRREIIPIKSWGLAEIASYGERFVKNGKRFSAGESPLPPDPRTSPDGSPRVLAGPLSTTGFKGDSPALNPYKNGDRKITLNFALAPGEAIDASEMARIFSPEKFLIKITPVNPTQTADKNRVTHCWVDHIPGAVRESAAALGSKGFQVIVSPSMPDEIAAATSCGQLWSNALGERAAFLEENKRREEACYLTAQNLAEKMRIFSRGIEQFKRRNFSVSVDKAALLVVDMQEFFLSPASPAYLPAGRVILANVRQLANAFRGLGRPVYFTAHAHEDPRIDGGLMTLWWKKICLAGSSGARVIPFLEAKEGEIFTKCRYSAFTNPDLAAVLRERGVEELVIAGIMTNLCVESTARDAFDKDFKTWVVADATAAHSGELHLASLQNLAYGFSQIVTTADIAKELTPVNHYAKL